MHSVSFITTEIGDDLIVSFATYDAQDPSDVKSLTLLRTPKYERLLEESERGVKVSFELDVDEDDLLEEVRFDHDTDVVRLKTQHRTYELDVRRVEKGEVKAMCKVLRKMNFDDRLRLSGV